MPKRPLECDEKLPPEHKLQRISILYSPKRFPLSSGVVNWVKSSKNLDGTKRALLIDWLIGISAKARCNDGTIFLAVNFLDRFMASHLDLPSSQFQLLGATCLWIASKFWDNFDSTLGVADMVFLGARNNVYNKQELLAMEVLILVVLNFDINRLDDIVLKYLPDPICPIHLYLAYLSLLEGHLLNCPPATVARAITAPFSGVDEQEIKSIQARLIHINDLLASKQWPSKKDLSLTLKRFSSVQSEFCAILGRDSVSE